MDIEEKKKKRFQFLHMLYVLTDGDFFKSRDMWKIGEALGFPNNLTNNIGQYLKEEGLIVFRTDQGEISITHEGVKEVEKALSKPNEPTNYFPPMAKITIIGDVIGSQIQQQSSEATQVSKSKEFNYENIKEVLRLIDEKIDQLELDEKKKSELIDEWRAVKSQLVTPKPDKNVLKVAFSTIKNILLGAQGIKSAYEILLAMKSIPTLF